MLALIGPGLSLVGCGPPGGYVTYPESGASLQGSVTYGGQPVAAAMIMVVAQSGPPVTGFIGDDGHYHIDNVPLGDVTIGVNTAAAKGQAIGKMMAQSQGKAKGTPKVFDVPGKYADPSKSGLKTTVAKGPNTFDIVLQK